MSETIGCIICAVLLVAYITMMAVGITYEMRKRGSLRITRAEQHSGDVAFVVQEYQHGWCGEVEYSEWREIASYSSEEKAREHIAMIHGKVIKSEEVLP